MVDDVYPPLGRKLQEARESGGMTQLALADRVQLSRSSLSNIEAGRQAVYVHQLIALAEALGKPVSHFLDRGVREPPSGGDEGERDGNEMDRLILESEHFPQDERP